MDLVLCRPCGRVTTELKDVMEDAELMKFYVFFANLEDVTSERYIQLCVDCEKKLNAAFEFRKTCLSGEALRKIKRPIVRKLPLKSTTPNFPTLNASMGLDDYSIVDGSIFPNLNETFMQKVEPFEDGQQFDIFDQTKSHKPPKPIPPKIVKPPNPPNNITIRQLKCPICKLFVYQSELEYHINLHVLNIQKKEKVVVPEYPYIELPSDENGFKRIQCQFGKCRAILKNSKGVLQMHMSRHFPELRKHMCSICGEKYYSRKCMMDHMYSHENYMPFQCDQCPQKFRRKQHMAAHFRSKHQNIRYVCKDCGRSYELASAFKFHVLLKHKGAKLVCNVCKKSFKHRGLIDTHLRKVHKLPFKQSIHIVLPNNETLMRSKRITEDLVFTSAKIDKKYVSANPIPDNEEIGQESDAESYAEEDTESDGYVEEDVVDDDEDC